jgi:hypothetical protein
MQSASKLSRAQEMVAFPSGFVPGNRHVVCAKGKEAKQHSANQLLQSLVKQHLADYSSCSSKLERSFIVSKVIKIVRNGGEGGFVRKMNGAWFEVGDRNAREKIGQAFRDSLSHMFKSSAKAKASVHRFRSIDSSNKQSPIVPVFPIGELSCRSSLSPRSIYPGATFAQHKVGMELTNLEPLPLSKAISVDLNQSKISTVSEQSSFEEAMHELYQSHFSSYDEDLSML